MRHANARARAIAALTLFSAMIPVLAEATTIAQNSAWTVTRPGATQTLRVVAYGDSIFAGYTGATTVARRSGPYVTAEYCAALTGQNWNVARRCQSGGVAQDVYNRINSSTDRAFMADASTRVVTFEMCGNDYLQARSSFKSAAGTCNYTGLNNALANCKNYTQLAMDSINNFASANTKMKIVSNLYYPGYDADNSFSTCTDAVNGDPANGFRVNMRNLFLPRLLESNWWTCKYAADKGFVCVDAFANYMARDYDSNADGMKDSDAIRYIAGESLASYQARVLALRSTLRDSNLKLINSTTSVDYLQSDDTHPTFVGATASTFLTTPSGNNPVFFATTGAYADGKNPSWNTNGHDRLGWAIDPACAFALVKCGNGVAETDWLPSGEARTEACDDANTTAGDGCSAACAVEPGYFCSGAPSMCAPVCGDGLLAGLEQCDDGNAQSGDGCSATCTVEPGFSCMGGPSTCHHICGDGLVVIGETCDDGNLHEADGCSAECLPEEGWSCSGEPSSCAAICGDSLVLGTEECDDGDANGTGPSCCSSACAFQANGAACDDGQICTDGDACDGAGVCVSGGPLDCSDGNICTDESCNPESGCEYSNNTASCDDDDACTVGDTCADGGCVSGGPRDCNDGNLCTDDSCNAATGCAHGNNTVPCNDGNACTAPDMCGAGMCVSGPAVYSFSGFLSPVDNAPVVNSGKAGRTYPVKWQLPLCSGGFVSRLNAVALSLRQVNCDTSAAIDALEVEDSGSSGLRYDAGSNQYQYNWKTESTFAGKCYDLVLTLDNGTQPTARFKFTK